MKKLSSKIPFSIWEKTCRWHIPVWIGMHALLFGALLLFGNFTVATDLSLILPETASMKAITGVETEINQRMNSGFYILAGSEDFQTARKAGVSLVSSLQGYEGIESIVCEIDAAAMGKMQDFLFTYRYQLLSPEIQEALRNNNIDALSEKAFMLLSSPISLGSLDRLNLDPFLLADSSLKYFLESGVVANMKIGLRDGVLSSDYEGKSWVLVSGTLGGSGFSVQTENNPVEYIHAEVRALSEAEPKLEFAFSGVPFHSFDSASKSQLEISVLSTISMIFIIIMILFVFRSIKPLAATVSAIIIGILSGLSAAFLVFQNIHILTIVFGTSLIGISLDYALHFFSTWSSSSEHPSGKQIIKAILPGVSIGLLTTLASYLGFVFTSFPLLQQMALFSMVGLISSFVTVILIFPKFKPAGNSTHRASVRAERFFLEGFRKIQNMPFQLKIVIGVLLSGIIIFGCFQLNLTNNIRDFYQMSEELKKSETTASAVLQHGSTGGYILTEGTTPEECRRKEEQFAEQLWGAKNNDVLEEYLYAAQLVPSLYQQEANYQLINTYVRPQIPAQMEYLGFSPNDAEKWEADFVSQKDKSVGPEAFFNLPLNKLLDSLWIGEIGGKYYSITMVFNVAKPDELKALADGQQGVFFVNKIAEVNTTLQELSILALIILGISYVVIFIGLYFRYGMFRSFQIIIIPCIASIISLTVLNLTGMPFNLFSVIGLILVPGMGTDYVIFFTEGKTHPGSTILAISLSMLTTVLSFGLLGFTSLAGVFGLTVALGVLLSFLLTPFLVGRSSGLQKEQQG